MYVPYEQYLKSDEWRKARWRALKRDNFQCCKCGSAKNLEVHHISYLDGLGKEQLDNLITLCHKCHAEIHVTDRSSKTTKSKSPKAKSLVKKVNSSNAKNSSYVTESLVPTTHFSLHFLMTGEAGMVRLPWMNIASKFMSVHTPSHAPLCRLCNKSVVQKAAQEALRRRYVYALNVKWHVETGIARTIHLGSDSDAYTVYAKPYIDKASFLDSSVLTLDSSYDEHCARCIIYNTTAYSENRELILTQGGKPCFRKH